jgi:hypothetical protein
VALVPKPCIFWLQRGIFGKNVFAIEYFLVTIGCPPNPNGLKGRICQIDHFVYRTGLSVNGGSFRHFSSFVPYSP